MKWETSVRQRLLNQAFLLFLYINYLNLRYLRLSQIHKIKNKIIRSGLRKRKTLNIEISEEFTKSTGKKYAQF